jgi:GR25 family glycosyltransferase involved in LPS biosynthesis
MKTFDNEIFIISLKNVYSFSKKRTDFLLQKLKNLGFVNNKIYFVGIDGTRLENKKINQKYISKEMQILYSSPSDNPHIGYGALGSALSHIIAFKLIKIKNIKNPVLILEEDALINKDFSFLLEKMPIDYDIIYLHSYCDKLFYDYTEQDNNLFFRKINQLHEELSGLLPPGRQALLINGLKIDKIMHYLFPYRQSGDWHNLTQFNNLNLYLTNPNFKLFFPPPPNESLRVAINFKLKQKYEN